MANQETVPSDDTGSPSIRIDVAGAAQAPAQSQAPLVEAVDEGVPLLGGVGNIRSYSVASDVSTASVRTIPALPGMKIRCHGIDANGLMFDCSSKEALRGAKRGKGNFWIDIDADERDADELRAWLGDLNLPLFFLSVIAERSETWATQVVAFKTSALTIVRFLPQKERTDTETHVAALSLPNLLMTFTSAPRSEAGDLYSTLHDYMHGEERLPDSTASGVLLALLRFHIDRTSRSMRKLRKHVLKVDEIMDRNVASVSIDAIIDAKDELLRLLACAEEQNECLVAYSTLHDYMHGEERLPDSTASGVLLALLRFHIDRTSRSMRKLRKHVLKVDEIMDRNVASVSIDAIIDAKDELLRLLACAEEQNECLVALERAEADTEGLDFAHLKGSLGVLIATTSATERMALRLEKQIADLRQRYEGLQQEKINRRLAVLTVLSAVFLPLTLFSGIWGMNFSHMPELNNPYGYYLALFLMVATASSMIFYFWRLGWFD